MCWSSLCEASSLFLGPALLERLQDAPYVSQPPPVVAPMVEQGIGRPGTAGSRRAFGPTPAGSRGPPVSSGSGLHHCTRWATGCSQEGWFLDRPWDFH
ncbi:hypothetical protein AVEN_11187-1, partial [Araneus ventricosus]